MIYNVKDIRRETIEDTEQKYSKPKYKYKYEGKYVVNKVGFNLTLIVLRLTSRSQNQKFTRKICDLMLQDSQRQKLLSFLFQLFILLKKLSYVCTGSKYHQIENNICCYSILAAALFA